jgi:hypothetical protein
MLLKFGGVKIYVLSRKRTAPQIWARPCQLVKAAAQIWGRPYQLVKSGGPNLGASVPARKKRLLKFELVKIYVSVRKRTAPQIWGRQNIRTDT